MIGLDAAEPRLVERWTREGYLPNLCALLSRGGYSRLNSSASWLAGSPWPTFYTGTSPVEHGLYHFLQWRPEEMAFARPDPSWLPLEPFWRRLGKAGRKVVAFDLPMVYSPTPIDGIEVSGWATHDRLAPPAAYPEDWMGKLRDRYGPPPVTEEIYGPQSVIDLLQLRDDLIQATDFVTEASCELMESTGWDLFMVGLGAAHRGGHKLWDLSGVRGNVTAAEEEEFNRALLNVYMACDHAVGRMVRSAGEDTTVLVFSLHGMGPNTSCAEWLPAMLERILQEDSARATKENGAKGLKRLRSAIPLHWRHEIKRRLPVKLQDRLTAFWRMGSVDWSSTQVFSLVADLQGYLRVNLRGREAGGVVTPGSDYEALCEKVESGLKSFVNRETGEPLVHSIARGDALGEGDRRHLLPDLVVRWMPSPAAALRKVGSERWGDVSVPGAGPGGDGRSGNHRPHGFLIAAGEGVHSSLIGRSDIKDLVPMVHGLLEAESIADFGSLLSG
jgi:predicted AlkP superfamily phosphohydrolase/phosphomutase